jgi:hypothetical protein
MNSPETKIKGGANFMRKPSQQTKSMKNIHRIKWRIL